MTAAPELRFVGGRYVVEFTADATRAARGLEWEAFQQLQAALYDLASRQGWVDTGRFPVDAAETSAGSDNVLRVGECAISFVVEPERNVLRVTAVARPSATRA